MSTEKPPFAQRRTVLGLVAALSVESLTGCTSWFHHQPTPVCPESPEVSYKDGPLTIDAHCHVFNGTDLQVGDFLAKVAVKQEGALGEGARMLGSILQDLAWSFAPDGPTELAELRGIAEALKSCTRTEAQSRVAAMRQLGYSTGRQQLRTALRRSSEFRPILERFTNKVFPQALDEESKVKFDAVSVIESLPEDVETYHAAKRTETITILSLKGRSARGMIDFVLQNFQYRYVSIHDYLRTYNEPGTRVVDLMLPSMVDYDWWLSKGRKTPTSLTLQVEVMEQISILTEGRVHGFAPYDPLRQIAHDLGDSSEDSFSVMTMAIEQRGCVGMKLYPPMGFAAYGNEEVQRNKGSHFWARDWLPDWTNRPDMGVLLDNAMKRALLWCEINEVPVMAHTNLSNGAHADFEALAGSHYWELALRRFPKLRVNFGHFGDTALVEHGLTRARAFMQLMNSDATKSGAFAYADAGYFVEVMGREPAMLDDLRQLYDETAGKGDAALANRFLYGTDWEMTLTEGAVSTYLNEFVKLFQEIESRPAIKSQGLTGLSAKFFGGNAVNFLGLRKGMLTRKRLDTFYSKNSVPVPDWISKVDRL